MHVPLAVLYPLVLSLDTSCRNQRARIYRSVFDELDSSMKLEASYPCFSLV